MRLHNKYKAAKPAFAPVRSRFLQRKTAAREREAERNRLWQAIQCYPEKEHGITEVPPIVGEVLRLPGQPLDPETRAYMESRFGHDFSQVRVHTDAKAAESAKAVNALAYVVGGDMVFKEGHYAPRTTSGKKLIAHELTHVLQQNVTHSPPYSIAQPTNRFEIEADVAASHVMHGIPVSVKFSHGPAIQRQEEIKDYNSALRFAKSLETLYPGWRNVLPNCPCTVDRARKSSEFQEDRWFVTFALNWGGYHPGAADSFRTKKGYQSKAGTSHGQQCIYDGKGRLITDGPAAGTPDFWSPETNYDNHQKFDVKPFKMLGWEVYNRYWVPNDGGPLCQGVDFPLSYDKTRKIA